MTQKIALITGAASGIGLAASELLLKDGIAVVMADRSAEVIGIAKELGARMGGTTTGMVVELSREENVLKLARDVLAQHGRVDILVNNAGVHPKNGGNKFYLEEITSEQWATVLAINLTAPFLLSRELIPQMRNGLQDGGGLPRATERGRRVVAAIHAETPHGEQRALRAFRLGNAACVAHRASQRRHALQPRQSQRNARATEQRAARNRTVLVDVHGGYLARKGSEETTA